MTDVRALRGRVVRATTPRALLQGVAGHVAYLAYAAGAVGAVVALQALPAIAADAWRVDHRLVVVIAATVTSVQVGQTVGIQNLLAGRLPPRARALGVALAVVAGAVVAVAPRGTPGLLAAGAVGGALGVATAARTVDRLVPGGRTAYQRAYCIRNLLWLAALVAVGAAGWLSVRSFVALTVLSWVVADRLDRSAPPAETPARPATRTGAGLPPASLLTLAVGFGSALLYRNDVNVVRLAVEGTPAFGRLHFLLLAHALAVAVVGFATGQLLYPALRGGDGVPPVLLRRLRLGFAGVAALAAFAAVGGLVAGGVWRDVGLLAAGSAVAMWSPLGSGLLHASRRSLAVYLPLLGCFLALSAAVRVDATAAFAAYHATVGVALLVGVSVLARRADAGAGRR